MSTLKTTADLFRERGWGVGTQVTDDDDSTIHKVLLIHESYVVVQEANTGDVRCYSGHLSWSPYTPTPPIPTREEWAELWAKLESFRKDSHVCRIRSLYHAIDAIAAKVEP
jgi:hypothetical protein